MTTRETMPEPQLRLPLPVVGVVAALLVLGLGLSVAAGGAWWQVLVLGVVQGLTEFLPISSTGHLLIVERLIGYDDRTGGTFTIFIQLGTVFSVLAFYGADLLRQARAVAGQADASDVRAARRLWLALLVAFVPAALVGLAFRKQIKAVLFESPSTIAYALIAGGVVFLAIELLPRRRAQTVALTDVSLAQALGVGVAQVLSLVPGVSRSGSSIVGGLLGGLDRRTATAFSFYLAIPILGAATLVDMLGAVRDGQIGAGDVGPLLLGAVVAMIVGWLSIGWLLRYVSRNSFVSFGVYRIVAGALILILVALGRL